MKIGYFDCFSGISGDMTLGALVSAGWPEAELRALPGRLRLDGVEIVIEPARRGPFAATQVSVRAPGQKAHRHLHHIEAILAEADLPGPVRDRARQVFAKLAAAEAEVHGTSVQKVHFHEVGAVDAIVDITGAVLGLDALGIGSIHASTLPLGGGTVMSEHGIIPVPAPATTNLLRGVPVRHGPIEAELVTPTGAALLATLVSDWGPPPDYRLERIGTGAGGRDHPTHPNVLRLLVGEPVGSGPGRPVAVLETAIDDENPEFVAMLIPRLLAAGALDAMLAPVQMKKGRLGSWLVVVSELTNSERLAQLIMAESTTLGVRVRTEQRFELPRRQEVVRTPLGDVTLKIAVLPDGSERPSAEFDSVSAVSAASGRPLREVSQLAIEAWKRARPSA